MGRPRLYKTEALVLKTMPLGESDRLLTLFALELGKLRAVARGARKPSSRLGGHVEPLTRAYLSVARGSSLDIVSQAETLEAFTPVRDNLDKTSIAIYMAELVDAFVVEDSPNPPLYHLTLSALRLLAIGSASEALPRSFELKLLNLTGFMPEVHCCVACRGEITPEALGFSAQAGGVLCSSCCPGQPLVMPLSVDALKVLRYFSRSALAQAPRVQLSAPLARELKQLNQACLRSALDRDMRSQAFVDLLRSQRH